MEGKEYGEAPPGADYLIMKSRVAWTRSGFGGYP